VLIIAEGLVAELDPEFRFAEALAPYARRRLLAGITPGEVIRRLERLGIDLAELATELPARLNRLTEAIENGGLEVHLRTDEMDALLARTERLGNRVAASVLAAALINGLVQLASRPRHRRTPRLLRRRNTASTKLATHLRRSRGRR
jgi:ubiquinone biosynthesis protein